MNQKETFSKYYNDLNAEQKLAVDTIDGPVLVIAGPGTGKTQILGARIGKILMETDTDPGNILCLTYTDAGAIAMRRRLLSFIGPAAYKVNIYTFHAFCNDIIQDNLFYFEKNSLDPVSELEQIQLLRELVDSFPQKHPLKRYRSDAYYEVKNLRSLFSTMKREGYTAAFIEEKINSYLADLPTREKYIYKKNGNGYKKGDIKKAEIDEQIERMEKLRAAIHEFDRFQFMMHEKGRYDYDDMINWVIKAFSENQDLLRRYQEKYQYILVDEYQDTSGTQNKVVELLISYWDNPNVFVVGDDDQSIYRFQGANEDNMSDFRNNYLKDLLVVVLTNNYRSTQPILDVSKHLISRNTSRLIYKMNGLSKDLVSSNSRISGIITPPVIREYESERAEMISLVSQIESLLTNGVHPGKIAVIYKENKYGQELLTYFKLKNLPVYNKRSINLLEDPLVGQLMLLVRYIASAHEHEVPFNGDEMLFEILHAEWFRIPAVEIATLAAEVAQKQYTNEKTSLRKLLNDKANKPAKDLFSQSLHPGLAAAGMILEKLISAVSNSTLQTLFETIFRETGLLQFAMESPDKRKMLETLTSFFDFIKEETRRQPALTLQNLVMHLDLMEKEEIQLPMVEVNGSADAVNLLTAHGSKGLEFTYIFFAGCNSHNWEKKKKPGGGFHFPDTMFSSVPDDDEELRRLFYVALTRAETHLYISFSRFRNNGKDAEPSVFIEEIRTGFDMTVEKMVLTTQEVMDFQFLLLKGEQPPEMERIEMDFINRVLEKFQMNVTALNNYLKCPLEFYFKNLIRIPSPKNENTEFGSAVHYALEQLFRYMQDHNNTFPDPNFFVGSFDSYMYRHRESFTKEQFARRMEYGHIVLPAYYEKYLPSWNKIVSIERTISNVAIAGVPVRGKLDKLEFDGRQVNVVDYKTGNIENALPKIKGPSEKLPNGGDYWRQAVFYKLLVDRTQRDWQVVSTEFDFIEPNSKKAYIKQKLFITPEDEVIVTGQITAVWAKIQNHDFYTGCGKEDCHWCNFVKTNKLDIASELAEEEEHHSL
jgi:DNA helicase II / ATP-dependent DNA helicase PcrA